MLNFSPLVAKNTTPPAIAIPNPVTPDALVTASANTFRLAVLARFAPLLVPPGASPAQALRDSLLDLTSGTRTGAEFAHGLADIIEAYVKVHLTVMAANMDINNIEFTAHTHPVVGPFPGNTTPAVTLVPLPPLYA